MFGRTLQFFSLRVNILSSSDVKCSNGLKYISEECNEQMLLYKNIKEKEETKRIFREWSYK